LGYGVAAALVAACEGVDEVALGCDRNFGAAAHENVAFVGIAWPEFDRGYPPRCEKVLRLVVNELQERRTEADAEAAVSGGAGRFQKAPEGEL
jgi:hypothetical protein